MSLASVPVDEQIRRYCACVHEGRLAKPACCQSCGRSGRLRWHGSYVRTVITLAETHRVTIKRVMCALCGLTFALLPVFIEKFHRYAKALIHRALRLLESRTYEAVADWLGLEGQGCVAVLTLHLWRRKFASA